MASNVTKMREENGFECEMNCEDEMKTEEEEEEVED